MSFDQVLQSVFQQCRAQGIPMLGQEKAEFMSTLVREARPDLVVECGTAIGNSRRARLSSTSKRTLDELPSILVFIVHPKG